MSIFNDTLRNMKEMDAAAEGLDARLKADDDGEFEVADTASLIDPGEYRATFLTWETRLLFGNAPKVLLWFDVAVPGIGTVKLARYFNVVTLVGPPRIHGRFVAGKMSDFMRAYCALFQATRLDRLSISRFSEVGHFKVEVRTVTRDTLKQKISEGAQYSTITKITLEPRHENP